MRIIALQVLNQQIGLGIKSENGPTKETKAIGENLSFTSGCQVREVVRRLSKKSEVICSA